MIWECEYGTGKELSSSMWKTKIGATLVDLDSLGLKLCKTDLNDPQI